MSHDVGVQATDPVTRLLLAGGLVGAVLFVVVFTVDGATRDGYDPARHPVSALALGHRGWVQVANFVVAGALMAGFAVGVRRASATVAGPSWGTWLLGAFAAGLIASGLFAMDPLDDFPPASERRGGGATSWRAGAHDVAGMVVFGALPAAALLLAGRFRAASGLSWLGNLSTAAGVLCAALFVAFAIVADADPGRGGLVQRAAIVVGWGWIAVVAGALLAGSSGDGAP